MKLRTNLVAVLEAILFLLPISATAWTAAGNRLTTQFAKDVDPSQPLPDYPRPGMVRDRWSNLNGIWSCSTTVLNATEPDRFPDQILVPFPVESSLSGLGQSVGPDHLLWYRRTFNAPELK